MVPNSHKTNNTLSWIDGPASSISSKSKPLQKFSKLSNPILNFFKSRQNYAALRFNLWAAHWRAFGLINIRCWYQMLGAGTCQSAIKIKTRSCLWPSKRNLQNCKQQWVVGFCSKTSLQGTCSWHSINWDCIAVPLFTSAASAAETRGLVYCSVALSSPLTPAKIFLSMSGEILQ